MSIYICDECGETKDDDYEPCCAIKGRPLDFICPDCYSDNLESDFEDSINGGLDID